MISIRNVIRFAMETSSYLWINAILVNETPKAILIIFDGRKAWIPKAWILQAKKGRDKFIKIKISDYHWPY
jgi:hypothetical protein